MDILSEVQYKLPKNDKNFRVGFLDYISPLGEIKKDKFVFNKSANDFVPLTSILFTDINIPSVSFLLKKGKTIEIEVANTTSKDKKSEYKYSRISIDDCVSRLLPYKLKYIDHTGFNLPYFDGIHPQILKLRNDLKALCLYHTFPKHLAIEPWDFILPGSREEIANETAINYAVDRKPKVEIVSFNSSSTPLIQFDIHLEGKYEDWASLFPEAIKLDDIKSLWVYLENNFGINICFVLNEIHEKDWGYHFAKERLI